VIGGIVETAIVGMMTGGVGEAATGGRFLTTLGEVWSGIRTLFRAGEAGTAPAQQGGAYRDVKGVPANEAHHMPADSVSPLSTGAGPAISMTKADHAETASYGGSAEAKAYRAQQAKLIEQGKFKEAQRMDIKDVQSKFGTKYDNAIRQMIEYTKKLFQ
jgi:hypothetical protein